MDIIDLDEMRREAKKSTRDKRKKSNGPESDMVMNVGGEKYYKFSVRYYFKGKNWTFELWAKNRREAEHRVHNIGHFPTEVCQILAERPA